MLLFVVIFYSFIGVIEKHVYGDIFEPYFFQVHLLVSFFWQASALFSSLGRNLFLVESENRCFWYNRCSLIQCCVYFHRPSSWSPRTYCTCTTPNTSEWQIHCIVKRLNSHTQRANAKHHNDKKHKYMNERKDTYVEVVEKYTRDGANSFTLMKHKHKRHTNEWRHHDQHKVVLRWLSKYSDLKNAWGEWEAAKDQGSFRLQTEVCQYSDVRASDEARWEWELHFWIKRVVLVLLKSTCLPLPHCVMKADFKLTCEPVQESNTFVFALHCNCGKALMDCGFETLWSITNSQGWENPLF